MSAVTLVCHRHSSSGLPTYLSDALGRRGWAVRMADPSTFRLATLGVWLRSFRPSKRAWHAEREREELYSIRAWHRNSKLAGRLVDANRDARILQIGGLYFPHPNYEQIEYNLFFTYTTRLALRDGYSPWVPSASEADDIIELETRLYKGARRIFVAAAFLRDHLVAEYGIDSARIVVAGMGVSSYYLDRMTAPVPNRFSYRALFVGFTWELKGGPDVVRAFQAARRVLPQLRLTIVGPHPTPEMQGEGIEALGPIRDKDALLELYRQADLLVLPSRCDSWGFVFLEAMTQGTVCIGSTMNAMPEIIGHGESGYVVPPGDSEALSKQILAFYADETNRMRLGTAARERVSSRFTWERVGEIVSAGL